MCELSFEVCSAVFGFSSDLAGGTAWSSRYFSARLAPAKAVNAAGGGVEARVSGGTSSSDTGVFLSEFQACRSKVRVTNLAPYLRVILATDTDANSRLKKISGIASECFIGYAH